MLSPLEQNVISHGDAFEGEIAVFGVHGDEAEVAGTATDVADQDHVAFGDCLTPTVLLGGQPSVEGRSGFLQYG